jgi:SAM-dependent methyltransferase
VAHQHPIDALYGIETGGVISASALRTNSSADLHNFGYVGSQPSIIRKALATIPNLDRASFVDFGCGKGRPLIVASEYPFRRIVGVELSPALCEIARRNGARISALHPERRPIEIVEGNVLDFEIPPGLVVIYLYNSFYAPLMKQVAAKVARHQEKSGNKVFLIYYNPANAKIFDRSDALSRYHAAKYPCDEAEAEAAAWRDDSVVIWQGTRGEMLPPRAGAEANVRVTAGGNGGEVLQATG